MGAARVIASYEALTGLTARMHDAASRGDWDALIAIEQERGALLAAMKPFDTATPLDEAARARKNTLIGEILACDAEIRAAVQSWMAGFQRDMQSNAQELRVLKTYGA
jgi:flagellar protein FliT